MTEIEQLKAKIEELENMINKPKTKYEPVKCEICGKEYEVPKISKQRAYGEIE